MLLRHMVDADASVGGTKQIGESFSLGSAGLSGTLRIKTSVEEIFGG